MPGSGREKGKEKVRHDSQQSDLGSQMEDGAKGGDIGGRADLGR